MSDADISNLLRQTSLSFVGTIEHLGAATMNDVPINDRTAVVRVEYVLHAPPSLAGLEGRRITLQLSADREPLAVGDAAAFFVEGLAFGESIAVAEVGRLPVEAVEPHATAAVTAGQTDAFASLQRQVEAQHLRDHADNADAVVVGRVTRLERAFGPAPSEHDPDWWKATLDVFHVEKGKLPPGDVVVLYPNSLDVRWRTAPKPKASQGGLWLLHATEGELRDTALFMILHPEDFQPTQNLEMLRGNEG